jgi:hypothetical protein
MDIKFVWAFEACCLPVGEVFFALSYPEANELILLYSYPFVDTTAGFRSSMLPFERQHSKCMPRCLVLSFECCAAATARDSGVLGCFRFVSYDLFPFTFHPHTRRQRLVSSSRCTEELASDEDEAVEEDSVVEAM